ncbi:MAG: enoyl-CoA hydratase/isomerase family protein [Candidatus Hodarchaeota archaeon]
MITSKKFAGVLILTLNRPAKLNALNIEILETLANALRLAATDSSLSYLLLRGAGRAFCAGADLHEVINRQIPHYQTVARYLEQLVGELNAVIELVQDLPFPTCALLQGSAAGGGFALGLAMDYRIAAPDLHIRAGPGLLGGVPAGGCTYFLPRILGDSLARNILLYDLQIEAQEALRLGIVDEILPLEWFQGSPEEIANTFIS